MGLASRRTLLPVIPRAAAVSRGCTSCLQRPADLKEDRQDGERVLSARTRRQTGETADGQVSDSTSCLSALIRTHFLSDGRSARTLCFVTTAVSRAFILEDSESVFYSGGLNEVFIHS